MDWGWIIAGIFGYLAGEHRAYSEMRQQGIEPYDRGLFGRYRWRLHRIFGSIWIFSDRFFRKPPKRRKFKK